MVKIIHVEIPKDEFSKDRVGDIVKYFGTEYPDTPMSQIDGVNCRVLVIRLRDGQYRKVIDELEKKGVGRKFGAIDTYSVESTKPALSKGSTFNRNFDPSIPIDALKERVWSDASLSCNFVLYVIVASVIAGIGLATNNAVAIVASMLVAPLMGPILCIIIGTLVLDCKMVLTGILSEVIGILLSFFCGVVIGLGFTAFVNPNCEVGVENMFCWPNFEMRTRGEWQGLISGLIVAIASGIGANLGVAHNNIASLAGTAISAALLPPIVNSGMMFIFGAFGGFMNTYGMNGEKIGGAFVYSGISLFLFFMNFFSILLSGLCVLFFKRVGPLRKKSEKYAKSPKIEVNDEENIKEITRNMHRSATFPPSMDMDNMLVKEVNERIDVIHHDDEDYL